ncbi:carbohydrate ABC transporter permease [Bauldia sp.]|uniref:carbohydrate ABC transporter permease n=1 Tax=Bauldia sp. TaxID=2575872 RepID=UPI003BAA5C5E
MISATLTHSRTTLPLTWRFWFVAPMVVALASVVLFPTVYLFWMSAQHWLVIDPDVYFNGVDNYSRLLFSNDLWQSIRVTGIYLLFSTGVMLAMGLGLALSFSNAAKSGWLRVLVVMPLVIPPVVAGFTWRFLLNGEMGFIGAFLLPSIGFEANMLANPTGAMASIVIADVWSRTPFIFLILLAALQGVPRELYEAARMDGATTIDEFFNITLPMLRGAIIVAVLFRLVDAINTFELIFVMTKGGPGRSTQVLSIFGWRTAFQELDFGQAAALGVLMLAMALTVAVLMFRRFLRSAEGR